MDVTVCVATFGGAEWVDLAQRAIRSAESQAPVVHRHGQTLTQARNEALALVKTEWVIFLDADDELTEGYVAAMERGTADVRGPVAQYVRGTQERLWQPRVAGHRHDCTAECLPDGNWLLVGSALRTDLAREVGGWRDFAWSEDWDLWLRCWRAGASFELVRQAIYRAHVRDDSRNRAPDRAFKNAVHWEIHRANFPEEYADVA